MSIFSGGRPVCAVCGRAVESFSWTHDPARQCYVFTAVCHGEAQVETLEEMVLLDATVTFAPAFTHWEEEHA